MLKRIAGVAVVFIGLLALSPSSRADGLSIYTEHQIVHIMNGETDGGSIYRTGDYPYIGQIGLQYDVGNWGYSLSYIHRSNVDLSEYEYYYDGIAAGIKYTHCVYKCN